MVQMPIVYLQERSQHRLILFVVYSTTTSLMSATSPSLSSSSPDSRKLTTKNADDAEVDSGSTKGPGLANLVKEVGVAAPTLPTPYYYRRWTPLTCKRPKIESEEQRKARLAEEDEREKEQRKVKSTAEKTKEALQINSTDVHTVVSPTIDRMQDHGPLSLTDGKTSEIPAPQSTLETSMNIFDFSGVAYPEGVFGLTHDLYEDAKEGKFRYVKFRTLDLEGRRTDNTSF